MADFLHDDDIVEFFGLITDGFILNDIPSYVRAAAYEEIVTRTDNLWVVEDATQLLNGRGDKWVFSKKVPIISIDSVKIIKDNLEEVELVVDQTDDERQIRFDKQTGAIQLVRGVSGIEVDAIDKFPEGLENVELIGQFGSGQDDNIQNILKMLQLYIMLRGMSAVNPSAYKTDIVSEDLGKYSYKLGGYGTSGKGKKTVDQMIDYYFDLLPFSGFMYETV